MAVLDEAFVAIATATANVEQNLANACGLFGAALEDILNGQRKGWPMVSLRSAGKTLTGNTPKTSVAANFGDHIPFIKPGDFQPNGSLNYANEGLSAQGASASRLIPAGSALMVCIGATIGKSGFTETDVTANQQINAFIPSAGLSGKFAYYQFLTERFQRAVLGNSGQATLPIINKSKWSDLEIYVPDNMQEQRAAVDLLDAIVLECDALDATFKKKMIALNALKQSLLHRAFTGELTASRSANIVPANDDWTSPEASAQILVFAHCRHVALNRISNFGHVKAQKSLQAVEAWGGLDLGRQPIKDRAGPNDFPHMRRAEEWAKQNGAFEFIERPAGGYDFHPLQNYSKLLDAARRRLAEAGALPKRAIELLVDMDSDWAEIIVTTHAAWNNLVLDKAAAADDMIVYASRDGWHQSKLRHEKSRFHDAIRFLRNNGLVPDGSAKRVGGQEAMLF